MLDLNQILADLISINSVNAYYKDGPGEHEIARYIKSFFDKQAIETFDQVAIRRSDIDSFDRSNVIVQLPGRDRNRRLILEAHMDTVSVTGMQIPPFEPKITDGKMYGRGACDTKAGLAAMMAAIAELKNEGQVPPIDVMLAAVVDEECSFKGVSKLCEEFQADGAIVAEPTELKIVVASKGVLRWRIKVKGKAAHSAKWHLGTNAINNMARVLLALERDHENLQSIKHPLLGSASCNVGVISGGVQINFVPDECVIEIDRRLLPEEEPDLVLQNYAKLLSALASERVDFAAEQEAPMLVDPAWAAPLDSSIVKCAKAAATSLRLDDTLCGVPFGSDASKLGRAGIPTIIFGPGNIDQAHSEVEFVDLAQVQQAKDFYKHCIMEFQ